MALLSVPRPYVPPGGLLAWQAKRVRLYIETNLAQPLGIGVIAAVLNLSPSHFCRVFKQTFGVTVHRYVMQRRIELAKHLMQTTPEKLSAIATSCGMSDQSHFTRRFQNIVGETPAVWRRASGERK